jgi:hypothetical protein
MAETLPFLTQTQTGIKPGINGVETTQAPESHISGAEVERPYDSLASSMEKVGKLADDMAVPFAKRAAAEDLLNQKVTRNADGTVSVATPDSAPLLFGDAATAYHDAIAQGTIATWRNQISQTFAETHQEHATDPQGFRKATDTFLSTVAPKVPPQMRQAIMAEGQTLQTQHLNAITDRAASIDVEAQKQSITASIEDQKNTLIALARKDGTDTPDFKSAIAKLNASYDALGTNPLFKMSADQIGLEKKNTTALLQGEAVVSSVDQNFTKKGKGDAQQQLERDVLQNPNLKEADRTRLYAQGMARLQYLTGDAKATVDANRAITTGFEKALADGKIDPQDPALGMAIQRSLAIGDTESTQRINAAAAMALHLRGLDSVPQSVRSDVTGGGIVPYKTRVQQIETGANPFQVSPTGSAGKYQFTQATWRQYGGGGNVFGNQEAAMDRLTADNLAGLRQSLGREPSPGELYLAHQQGAAGAAALLQNPNARAGSLVGDQAIRANGGDPNAPASAFTNKWITTFERPGVISANPRAIAAPGAHGGPGFTAEDVQRNPFLLSAYVRTLAADPDTRVQAAKNTAEAVGKAIDNGILPPPTAVAEVNQAAALFPDKVGKIADEMNGRLRGQEIAALDQPRRDQITAAYRAATSGQDQHQINLAAAALAQVQRQDENMREHPFDEAARRGWTPTPPPIDPTKPDSIAGALVRRADLAARIGTLNNTPPPNLLDKDEMPKLQTVLQGPTGGQVLTSIAQSMKPEEMHTLLQEEAFRKSVTGMSRSGDPAKMNASYSFMDTLQKQNPLEFDRQFPDGLKDLRSWQSLLGFYPPEEAAKRMLAAYDPNQSAAREAMDKQVDKALEKVSPANVVSKFSTGFIFGTTARAPITEQAGAAAGALKYDYDKNFRDAYAATGDAGSADAVAMEKLRNKYAVSPTNDNRVTAYPPEKYYPQVGGSHDWMARQLDDVVAKHLGVSTQPDMTRALAETGEPTAALADTQTAAERQYGAARVLVPDAVTERDIAAGRPPSYQIAIQDQTGRWGALDTGGGTVGETNLQAADAALKLTPQEKNLYQMHLTNLRAGGVPNQGGLSTLFQVTAEHDGKTYNVPTVWNGKILPPPDAIKEAAKVGWDKFPSYANEDEAEARYQQMHAFMEKDTQQFTQPAGPMRMRFDPTQPFAERAAGAEAVRPTIQQLQQPFAGAVTP